MTPKESKLAKELIKKENSLSGTAGYASVRSEASSRKPSYAVPFKDTVVHTLPTQEDVSTITQTLNDYMPKKNFLKNDYNSLKSAQYFSPKKPEKKDSK